MFGRKKENGINWEEKIKPDAAEEKAEEKMEIEEQAPKAVLPGKAASEAAKALDGIKALIESLQVTDEATWAEVEEKGRKALGSLVKMESALETALGASREARAVLEEFMTAVGERR
ncbi:hypothetical protein J2Z49_002646 [Desulfofundulus luciae]|uniref:Signal recognition particle-docking protein FtsY n=1 Tax=Desulfofundulus luciae TaxID=74702 RepID=A0ABU0B466_9FIRM|nr:hypothetical protein [Desulfofundulus luciae]MDQ0287518.1 hypothetical protein [Desulfofundulus luciae]